MTRGEVKDRIAVIVKEVFDDDSITICDETVATDVEGWDSLMHITLIGTIESELRIKFSMKDVVGMKNVGQLIDRVTELTVGA